MPSLDAAACAALMEELTKLTAQAAETILDLASGSDVRTKADGSPVTAADEAAEAVICAGLQRLVPALPIISEEQAARQKPTAIVRGSYFLVDPLDGTREFIAGRDEYTINIALMSDGAPLLGIICAPALHLTWRGIVGRGADRIAGGGTAPAQIHTRPRPSREVVIVVSRSHLDAHTRAYVDGFPRAKLVQSGSSIKFCRVAEGAGRYLSAARADAGLGYRGGSRHPQSGRWRGNRAGWLAAALCDARSFDPGFYCVGPADYGMSPCSTAGHFRSAGPTTRSGSAANLPRRSSS